MQWRHAKRLYSIYYELSTDGEFDSHQKSQTRSEYWIDLENLIKTFIPCACVTRKRIVKIAFREIEYLVYCIWIFLSFKNWRSYSCLQHIRVFISKFKFTSHILSVHKHKDRTDKLSAVDGDSQDTVVFLYLVLACRNACTCGFKWELLSMSWLQFCHRDY